MGYSGDGNGQSPDSRPRVFVSFSHKDEETVDLLLTHLRVAEFTGHIVVLHDGRLREGDDWRSRLRQFIDVSSLAIPVLSAHYLTSKFSLEQEVPEIQYLHSEKGQILLPVLLRPCPWWLHPWIEEHQLFTNEGKALLSDPASYEIQLERLIKTVLQRLGLLPDDDPDPVAPTPLGIGVRISSNGKATGVPRGRASRLKGPKGFADLFVALFGVLSESGGKSAAWLVRVEEIAAWCRGADDAAPSRGAHFVLANSRDIPADEPAHVNVWLAAPDAYWACNDFGTSHLTAGAWPHTSRGSAHAAPAPFTACNASGAQTRAEAPILVVDGLFEAARPAAPEALGVAGQLDGGLAKAFLNFRGEQEGLPDRRSGPRLRRLFRQFTLNSLELAHVNVWLAEPDAFAVSQFDGVINVTAGAWPHASRGSAHAAPSPFTACNASGAQTRAEAPILVVDGLFEQILRSCVPILQHPESDRQFRNAEQIAAWRQIACGAADLFLGYRREENLPAPNSGPQLRSILDRDLVKWLVNNPASAAALSRAARFVLANSSETQAGEAAPAPWLASHGACCDFDNDCFGDVDNDGFPDITAEAGLDTGRDLAYTTPALLESDGEYASNGLRAAELAVWHLRGLLGQLWRDLRDRADEAARPAAPEALGVVGQLDSGLAKAFLNFRGEQEALPDRRSSTRLRRLFRQFTFINSLELAYVNFWLAAPNAYAVSHFDGFIDVTPGPWPRASRDSAHAALVVLSACHASRVQARAEAPILVAAGFFEQILRSCAPILGHPESDRQFRRLLLAELSGQSGLAYDRNQNGGDALDINIQISQVREEEGEPVFWVSPGGGGAPSLRQGESPLS